MESHRLQLKRKIMSSIIITVGIVIMLTAIPVSGVFAQETSQETNQVAITPERADMAKWAFISAAIAFGFGALGAGIGIANVGAAAMGAVSEKPEIAGQALIFIALAEGLVVFGFITALIILGRV